MIDVQHIQQLMIIIRRAYDKFASKLNIVLRPIRSVEYSRRIEKKTP